MAALVSCEKQCFLQKHHLFEIFEIRSASYLQFFTVSVTVSCALTCVLVGKCARLQGSLQFQREKSGQTSAVHDKNNVTNSRNILLENIDPNITKSEQDLRNAKHITLYNFTPYSRVVGVARHILI